MAFINFIWLLVWSGMFSDPGRVSQPNFPKNFFELFQGVRAYGPLLACFICLILLIGSRSKFILYKNTLGFLFLYCLIGTISSVFMSPDPSIALFWAGSYLSALLAVWTTQQQIRPLEALRAIIKINYFVVFFFFISFMPQTIDIARGRAPFTQFFKLPFNLDTIRINGVGRFALIAGIVAFVRMNFSKKRLKIIWIAFIGLSLLMMSYTRSRTTLLGLAVTGLLFAYIQKLDWRFLFASPVASYVLWVSGYKWRAQEHLENLINLTGREYTWQRGLEKALQSPIYGWGFHADRLLLKSEHMHNSYLHSAIHSGFLGTIFFTAGVISIWFLMIRRGLLKNLKYVQGEDKPFLLESILLVGYFTIRGIFESTAAFYGVDLLIYLPAAAYIIFWLYENPDFGRPESQEITNDEA